MGGDSCASPTDPVSPRLARGLGGEITQQCRQPDPAQSGLRFQFVAYIVVQAN
jgi:hypothetical protein